MWRFLNSDDVLEEIAVSGNLESDNGHALLTATLAGVGISLMPDWAVREHLASGRLRRLLPNYRISHIGSTTLCVRSLPAESSHVGEDARPAPESVATFQHADCLNAGATVSRPFGHPINRHHSGDKPRTSDAR